MSVRGAGMAVGARPGWQEGLVFKEHPLRDTVPAMVATDERTPERLSEIGPEKRRRSPRIGAFFDMDKTIIAENSGSVYMKHKYEQGELDALELVRGLGAYLQYKIGVLDILSWTKSMMTDFRGRSEADVIAEANVLFDAAILPAIYPEAVACIRHHQDSGHVVCIVSGATKFVVEPLARHLGVEHMVYTRLEVENGLFTGRVVEPICFEEGKIYWLQQFIAEEEIDLAKSWFYTDSVTDRPLLDLVGHPVVVNPDPLLYRLAVRRRWPVCFFAIDAIDGDADGVTPVGLEVSGYGRSGHRLPSLHARHAPDA
ncbi:MAG: HAD family hydrolase [Deltaproteobacteria bacterium]|nr:HAD family hydrolase [Deltaproteobacteria bacterium]